MIKAKKTAGTRFGRDLGKTKALVLHSELRGNIFTQMTYGSNTKYNASQPVNKMTNQQQKHLVINLPM